MHCPKCKSKNIKSVDYMGVKCILCKDCGFDERDKLEEYPEDRSSQKAKGEYSKYKVGGGKRTRK